jgi:hypothetical protein
MKKCFEYPNKNRYNTQRDAETAILLLDNKSLSVYKCDGCGGWHLTSNLKNKKS